MKNRLISKLRMPDGSINPWVIAVTVTLATFLLMKKPKAPTGNVPVH